MEIEIRIVFTNTPAIILFCKIYWLMKVDVCQRANSQFLQTWFLSRWNTRRFFERTDVASYFNYKLFDISQSQHRIVQISKGSNKKSFAIKLFQFCDIKTQQRYVLREEMNITKRELIFLVDTLRDFLKTFDQASKCI